MRWDTNHRIKKLIVIMFRRWRNLMLVDRPLFLGRFTFRSSTPRDSNEIVSAKPVKMKRDFWTAEILLQLAWKLGPVDLGPEFSRNGQFPEWVGSKSNFVKRRWSHRCRQNVTWDETIKLSCSRNAKIDKIQNLPPPTVTTFLRKTDSDVFSNSVDVAGKSDKKKQPKTLFARSTG